MCGITGLVDRAGRLGDDLHATASAMASMLYHRGPDDGGVWTDPDRGVALASRRLAVIDLSPSGHQPMVGRNGRLALTYNGEIYNFRGMRRALESEGCRFRGHSDTEVLLEAAERWGVREALQRSDGMFALALWDAASDSLHLARDRMGEKPLYYGWLGETFVFGSELKALKAHPDWKSDVNPHAVSAYFNLGYVPAPHSIYAGIYKLPPGTMVTLRVGNGRLGDPEAFWSLGEVAQPEHRTHRTPEQAIDALETVLSEAVVSQMVADVPIGAFLSGGVDSSIVVALMQRFNSGKVRTFTIGFEDPSYDESADAARIARHLGTEHAELRLTAADALAVVPDLPQIYDEPFADWSQIPTLLVSRFAREEVTVALSGDGGDELFGGYNRYSLGLALWDRVATVPLPMRRVAGQLIKRIPTGSLDTALEVVVGSLPTRFQVRTPGTKLRKLGEVLPASSLDDLYARLICLWREPGALLLGGVDPSVALAALTAPAALVEPVERMMFSDTVGYLPDDILVKVDRASMAVSLEVRVPMLDRRVVEFAWTLSPDQRLRGRVGKWCLRQLLERYVPTNLMDRPKMGFGLPLGAWLRGPLRGWATSLLDPRRVASEGYLSAEVVDHIWKSHLSGRRDQEHLLWSVLAFEAWLEREQK